MITMIVRVAFAVLRVIVFVRNDEEGNKREERKEEKKQNTEHCSVVSAKCSLVCVCVPSVDKRREKKEKPSKQNAKSRETKSLFCARIGATTTATAAKTLTLTTM